MTRFSLVLLLALALSSCALAQDAAVPCKEPGIAVAADGSGVWVTCSPQWEAWKSGPENTPPPAAYDNPTDLYWLETGKNVPVKVFSSPGLIRIREAPSSALAMVVDIGDSSDRVLLFRGKERIKALPFNSTFLLWGADAKTVYFYGGTTVQADGWNILGIYDLEKNVIRRKKLVEPTEILGICPATGNVYSTTPAYPGSSGRTVEYTSTIQFVKRIQVWVGATFSAHCRYVASESSFHGPLPWSIYDTDTGRELFQFDFSDEPAKGDMYSLISWNPTHESIILRDHISTNQKESLESFDVQSGKVLQTIGDLAPAAWSADGNSIIVADGTNLRWIPATFGADAKSKP